MNCLIAYVIDGHQENPQLTADECIVLSEVLLHIRNLRVSNSCFDIMMTAQGKYGAWINRTSRIWENVTPQIIVEEAGGRYTDFIGNTINYVDPMSKAEKNFTVCAASEILHLRLQEIIKKYAFTD
jgi:myo-inositol-1(or 4)-monophosphatase